MRPVQLPPVVVRAFDCCIINVEEGNVPEVPGSVIAEELARECLMRQRKGLRPLCDDPGALYKGYGESDCKSN